MSRSLKGPVLGSPATIMGRSPLANRAPALIMLLAALGRLFGAAFALPGCALREISGGATMTIPGGAGTPYVTVSKRPRARRTGFYHGVGASTTPLCYGAPTLRSPPPQCPKSSPLRSVVSAYTST